MKVVGVPQLSILAQALSTALDGIRNNIIIPVKVMQKSRYKFIVRKADESVVSESAWSPNLTTNGGLDYICGNAVPSSWGLNGIHVGSGNTAPSPGDTSLTEFVAGTVTVQTASTSTTQVSPKRYTRMVTTFRFAAGVAAGNLSEVGVAIGTSSTPGISESAGNPTAPLFSHALILDGGGLPTTITVLSDEVLDVVWEWTLYAPDTDLTGTFTMTIDGTPTNFDYTLRPCTTYVNNWNNSSRSSKIQLIRGNGNWTNNYSGASNGVLGAVFGYPTGSDSLVTTVANSTYVPGTYYRDVTMGFGLNDGNLSGGISCYKFVCSLVGWQMQISPVVLKTAVKTHSITLRVSAADGIP